jgi:hypothetical protein
MSKIIRKAMPLESDAGHANVGGSRRTADDAHAASTPPPPCFRRMLR